MSVKITEVLLLRLSIIAVLTKVRSVAGNAAKVLRSGCKSPLAQGIAYVPDVDSIDIPPKRRFSVGQ